MSHPSSNLKNHNNALRNSLFATPLAAVLAACASGEVDVAGVTQSVVSATAVAERPYFRPAKDAIWWEFAQNWSDETRRAFWYTPQGSRIMPLSWFKALKHENGDVFASASVLDERYGYIQGFATSGDFDEPLQAMSMLDSSKEGEGEAKQRLQEKWNKFGLPIGFAVSKPEATHNGPPITWVGPTCAACHVSRIKIGQFDTIIDGAPSLSDFYRFNFELIEALAATKEDPEKYKQFKIDVLEFEKNNELSDETLAPEIFDERFESITKSLLKYVTYNLVGPLYHSESHRFLTQEQSVLNDEGVTAQPQTGAMSDYLITRLQSAFGGERLEASRPDPSQSVHHGRGRVDALTAILNQVTAVDLDYPKNVAPATAPVSYPMLWGAPQSAVVQWTGFAANDTVLLGRFGFSPLGRNVGQVLGVYGAVALPGTPTRLPDGSRSCAVGQEGCLLDYRKMPQGSGVVGYRSSVNVGNLGVIEAWLRDLRSPKWPDPADLPSVNGIEPYAIDDELSQLGESVFAGAPEVDGKKNGARCHLCHEVIKRNDEEKSYTPVMIETYCGVNSINGEEYESLAVSRSRDLIHKSKLTYSGSDSFEDDDYEEGFGFAFVGTDPEAARNFVEDRNPVDGEVWSASKFKGRRNIEPPLPGLLIPDVLVDNYGEGLASRGSALRTAVSGVISNQVWGGPTLSAAVNSATHSGDTPEPGEDFDFCSYKARPLNGVWASAPYLHNGSVPTIADLLKPASDRPVAFTVGNPSYDPTTIGFAHRASVRGETESATESGVAELRAQVGEGEYVFDTTQRGNSNIGHEGAIYGTELDEDLKKALVEYIKTL